LRECVWNVNTQTKEKQKAFILIKGYNFDRVAWKIPAW